MADFVDHPADAIIILMDLRLTNPTQTKGTDSLTADRVVTDQATGLSDYNLRHRGTPLGVAIKLERDAPEEPHEALCRDSLHTLPSFPTAASR